MAHFAELDENNVVLRVIVVHNNELLDGEQNESEQLGIDFCVAHYGGRWIQTSYNGKFRKNYAGSGWLYDPIRDAFIPSKPYESFVLNEDTCQWEPPVPYPTDGKSYSWNEETVNWAEVDPNYVDDWYFTMGAHEFFDRNMTEFIDKPNLKFLEIGSWTGGSAIEQIKNVLTGDNSNITCLDIWENSELEASFDQRTAQYADKITKVKSDSKVWLEQNQDELFDFIYIDADHSAQGIESDTRLAWPLLKIGGVMALDDVLLNDETELANRKFVESVKNEAIIIDDGYQIWLRKMSI
jgi:hypothetical protein